VLSVSGWGAGGGGAGGGEVWRGRKRVWGGWACQAASDARSCRRQRRGRRVWRSNLLVTELDSLL
jgi:hypothetical protein